MHIKPQTVIPNDVRIKKVRACNSMKNLPSIYTLLKRDAERDERQRAINAAFKKAIEDGMSIADASLFAINSIK